MLEAAGLTAAEEDAYRALLDTDETDLEHLARAMRVSAEEASDVLASLELKGLVARPSGGPPRYAPVPPDVGLEPLLLERRESLEWARTEVARLTAEYRASLRRRDATELVQVITGGTAIRQALRNFQHATRQESLWFCRAGYVAMPSTDNTEEFEMLDRGVRYRVIYEQPLLEEPGIVDNVADGIKRGEIARAVPSLPVRLAIADRSVGLCPLVSSVDGPGEPSVALVRESNLLEALIALFESYWAGASPLALAGSDDDTVLREAPPADAGAAISDDDRWLLSLLVAGVTDKAIAARLRVSLRTVQRRIRALMDKADADTRMQLAWQAARRGWV